MKYIRTKNGQIFEVEKDLGKYGKSKAVIICDFDGNFIDVENQNMILKQADTIEELCDCFIKIKRKKDYRDYILKFDFKDLPLLKQQRIKYPTSPVYGAIHIEDKGLIYVAKMNDKGELELL